MQRPFTATPARQRGAVMVLIVIALASILLMGALALDGGHMLLNKARLQNAVDAAALSGAKTLQQVKDSGNAYSRTQADALNTLQINANADGNAELADAFNDLVINVELSRSVYGPFDSSDPGDASYVRVSVANYGLSEFFWGILQATGGGASPEKEVTAIATAGPPPCGAVPLMVCGNPAQHDPGNGNFWGYKFGDLVKLTCGTPGSPSSGNCQLLDFPGASGGGAAIREAFCKGIKQCVGDTVDTKPGMTWGPVAQGLNTRLGLYSGPVDATCPPDWYTDYSEPLVTMNGDTPMYKDAEVTSDDGDLSTVADDVLDIKDWRRFSKDCANNPGTCPGKRERRVLNVVIGNCAAAGSGSTTLPVLGTGCFHLLQKVEQGAVKEVFGQFVKDCGGADQQTIQLYKTYIGAGVGVPSPDS